jgi:hypothetical protein
MEWQVICRSHLATYSCSEPPIVLEELFTWQPKEKILMDFALNIYVITLPDYKNCLNDLFMIC